MHPLPGEKGTAHRHPCLRRARMRDPELGSRAAWSCTKAATHSKQIHRTTERRKVRQKQKQKLTLKGRGEEKKKKGSNCELLPERVGGCCAAAATWDFRGCTLTFCFSLVWASLLWWQKAAVLGEKTGGINRRVSFSSAWDALLICLKDFWFFSWWMLVLDLDFESF